MGRAAKLKAVRKADVEPEAEARYCPFDGNLRPCPHHEHVPPDVSRARDREQMITVADDERIHREAREREARRIIQPLKLDFGCGPHKREGFLGVDATPFVGVDQVVDLRKTPWPWETNSVGEAHAAHFVEHLTAAERMGFCNELYRILIPNGTCQIIVPHWAASRAYGDPTHQWPPVSEFWFYYLNKEWREQNAPHTDGKYLPGGFDCNFAATWGYAMRQDLTVRNAEFQQFAIANYKEACQDLMATLTAVK